MRIFLFRSSSTHWFFHFGNTLMIQNFKMAKLKCQQDNLFIFRTDKNKKKIKIFFDCLFLLLAFVFLFWSMVLKSQFLRFKKIYTEQT